LKTGVPQGTESSNPSASAKQKDPFGFFCGSGFYPKALFGIIMYMQEQIPNEPEEPNSDSPTINEYGEVIRLASYKKPEYPPALELTMLYEGMSGGNILPQGFENQDELTYYNQRHIEEAKNTVKEIKCSAGENNIEFLMDYNGNPSLPVVDVLKSLEENIEFSEKIHQQLSMGAPVENTSQTTEEHEEKRLKLFNKLQKNKF
jgi:hypothetical protein